MTEVSRSTDTETASRSTTLVDPRAPRFGQTITTLGLVAGIALGRPELVAAIAFVLTGAVLSGWRFDVYGFLWRTLLIPIVGAPTEREPAAPHRFAKLIGAVGTSLAVLLFAVGVPTAGFAVAGVVALAAGLAAATGICLGCRFYQQVSFARRIGIV